MSFSIGIFISKKLHLKELQHNETKLYIFELFQKLKNFGRVEKEIIIDKRENLLKFIFLSN